MTGLSGWSRSLCLTSVLSLLSFVRPASAQTPDDPAALQRTLQALRDSQAQLRRELQDLRLQFQHALGGVPAALPRAISIANSPIRGAATAPITIVEFSDYQCPFCGQFVAQSYPELYDRYIATGRVRYVLRDFPLMPIHPFAFKAAEAAHCASDQGQYWRMHDRLFDNQRALAPQDLLTHAQGLGLNVSQFDQCLRSNKYADRVRTGLTDGQQAGVNATPTFFIGFTNLESSGVLRPVQVIRGAKSFADFDVVLKSLTAELERRESQP